MTRIEHLLNRPEPFAPAHLLLDDDNRPPLNALGRPHFPLLGFGPGVPPPLPPKPARRYGSCRPRLPFRLFQDYIIRPTQLGFIPAGQWTPGAIRLSAVVAGFFRARASRKVRFEHKLWNALALTSMDPMLYELVGVVWITRTVLKVNRDAFGAFINITRPAAALYNSQGYFAAHGFRELPARQLRGMAVPEDLMDVDESLVRLFEHEAQLCTIPTAGPQWCAAAPPRGGDDRSH
jgi:hypothetical protein